MLAGELCHPHPTLCLIWWLLRFSEGLSLSPSTVHTSPARAPCCLPEPPSSRAPGAHSGGQLTVLAASTAPRWFPRSYLRVCLWETKPPREERRDGTQASCWSHQAARLHSRPSSACLSENSRLPGMGDAVGASRRRRRAFAPVLCPPMYP